MFLDLLLTLALVLLNGFFVAAEFAIVKVRHSQLETTDSDRVKASRTARGILNHLDAYLSATQLGITLASLGLGFVGERVIADILVELFQGIELGWTAATAHAIAFPAAFAFITTLHIVFGELAPKTLAIRFPLNATRFVALPLRAFYVIFRPFIWLLNGMANGVLRLGGIAPAQDGEASHTEDEIRYLVAQSQRAGSINEVERQLIERVFAFDERVVRQVMVPRTDIVALDCEEPPADIVDFMLEATYSRVPVYRNSLDEIQGVLVLKEVVRLEKLGQLAAWPGILRPVVFVPGGMHLNDLLRRFQRDRSHVAIVTDEFGGTIGLVTLEDVIEELTGQIYDETEDVERVLHRSGPNEYTVSAQTSILDLNEALPFPLPEGRDYGTLAGLILQNTRRLPPEKALIVIPPYEVEVLERTPYRIETAKLRVLQEATPQADPTEANPT